MAQIGAWFKRLTGLFGRREDFDLSDELKRAPRRPHRGQHPRWDDA
jgi:hypothetical protein